MDKRYIDLYEKFGENLTKDLSDNQLILRADILRRQSLLTQIDSDVHDINDFELVN